MPRDQVPRQYKSVSSSKYAIHLASNLNFLSWILCARHAVSRRNDRDLETCDEKQLRCFPGTSRCNYMFNLEKKHNYIMTMHVVRARARARALRSYFKRTRSTAGWLVRTRTNRGNVSNGARKFNFSSANFAVDFISSIIINLLLTHVYCWTLQGRYIARTLSTEKKYVETTEKNGVDILFMFIIIHICLEACLLFFSTLLLIVLLSNLLRSLKF